MRTEESAGPCALIRLSVRLDPSLLEVARGVLAARLRHGLRAGDRLRLWTGEAVETLVAAPADAEGAALLAERLRRRVSEPLRLHGALARPETRMGWSLAAAGDAQSWRQAWRAARHKNEALALLRAALAGDGLSLAFQPVVALASGRAVGAEALARLKAPGAPGPGVFAPLAEAHGLIHALGERTTRLAARQARIWAGPRVAVNAAAAQIESPDFADMFFRICAEEACPPRLLAVEITESAAFSAPERGALQLARLRAAGVKISIDDFGVAHGDFVRIAAFPADALKLDASLVRRAAVEPHAARVLEGLAALARALGMICVGEGVETEAHARALMSAGIDYAQGDFYAPAADAATMARFWISGVGRPTDPGAESS